MKNNTILITKQFEETGVEIIINKNGEPEFELYSSGSALGYSRWVTSKGKKYINVRKDRIDTVLKNAEITGVSHGGKTYLTEQMLYDFMLEARTEKCKAFRKWVTGEVLPSIRKNGGYIAGATEQETKKIVKQFTGSKYLTEEIHDRKSIRKYIREYNPMQLDECIDKIVDIVAPMKGSIKHELLDVAIKELKKIDDDLMKDTIKHTYIKDTCTEGIITLQDVKIGKFKKRIKALEQAI